MEAGAQEPTPQPGVLTADIVFAIDDSLSMANDAGYVKDRVGEMVGNLADAGIDPRFGLVEYAQFETIRTPLTDDLDAFRSALSVLSANNGNPEAGFSAVVKAMSEDMGFRQNAGVCVMLISDEDADVRTHTRGDAVAAMQARGGTFFGIVDTTHGTTSSDYGPSPGSLAAETDGAVYPLTQFRDDPSAILDTVVASCAQRVIEEQTEVSAGPDQQVVEGDDVVLSGQVPVTTRSATSGGVDEELLLNTYSSSSDGAAGPVWTSAPLTEGATYDVTISGTYTVWNNSSYCGAPEVVQIPSPGHSAGRLTTHDAEFRFAAPSGCTSDYPVHAGSLQFDVGDGFAHLEPAGGQPTEMAPDHTYHYQVVGQGQPLGVRRPDHPLNDNSGMLRIVVEPAEELVPWDFDWELISTQGAPIELLGTESLNPTFRAVDDGVHRFRLTATDGDQTQTDDVLVTVGNVAPELGAAAAPTAEDGLIMVSASVTDVGILDDHRADVEWGDGTSSTGVPAGAQGAGWAAVSAGHVYDTPGTYDIAVTIVDDDGGRTTSTTSVEVGGAGVPLPEPGVALWADDPAGDGIVLAGNDDQAIGLTHSNARLRISGNGVSLLGGSEYVTDFVDVPGTTQIDPGPTQVAATQPPPVVFDLDDYAPGGQAAVEAGDAYHDLSGECGRTWRPGGEIAPGLYWVPCDVDITGRAFAAGPVTIVATGDVKIAGRDRDLQAPFVDGLAVASASDAAAAIQLRGSSTDIGGYLYAPDGGVDVTGGGHTVTCGVIAASIMVGGGDHTFDAGACGTLDDSGSLADGVDVAASPLLVPTLANAATPSVSTLAPGTTAGVTAQVDNTGATLAVPGLVALANTSGNEVTVAGAAYELEVYDVAADVWLPLVGSGDGDVAITGHPVAAAGVTYAGDDGFTGTIVDDQAAGAWAATVQLRLDDAQVERLLDPARTMAVRSRLTLDVSSTLRVRQTTRFGGNVVEALHAAGGDVTDVTARVTSPAGVQDSGMLGDLGPGAGVAWSEPTVTAPTAPLPPVGDDGDASYLAALRTLDRGQVVALARAQGESAAGRVGAVAEPVLLPVDLPIVAVDGAPLAATRPGETATWAVTLRNTGSTAAHALSLAVESAGVPTTIDGLPDTLAPGADAEITVSVDVPPDRGDTVVLRAEAAWQDATGQSYGPVGADGALRILLPSALEIRKWVDTDAVVPHGQIPYVIALRNTGDDDLTATTVVDQLEAGVRLLPNTVEMTQGSLGSDGVGDGLLQFDLGTLVARDEVMLRYRVDATGIAPGDRTVVNQAVATADGLPESVSDDPATMGDGQPTVHVFSTAPNPDDDPDGSGSSGGDGDAPMVEQVLPADGSAVTEPVDVSATLTGQEGRTVTSWEISTYRADAGPSTAEVLGTGDTAAAPLAATTTEAEAEATTASATFDPTLRDNGAWVIRFVAVDEAGNRAVHDVSVVVDGDLKLGRVVTTHQDLEVGTGGIPLRLVRTYDSLRRDVSDDLGHGWDLSVAGIRVQTNTELGRGPWASESCGAGLVFVDVCWASQEARFVTITWPDGRTETFDFTPTGNTFFRVLVQAAYTPRPGVTSTLEPIAADATAGLNFGDGHIHTGGFGDGPIYDPKRFVLTDRFGTEYVLDVDEGLVSMADRVGNHLTVDDAGITSNFGPSVVFTRDAQGRIEAVDGPGSLDLAYGYDAAGDLVSVTDPNLGTTTYEYDDHRLTGAVGPDTSRLATYTYEDGRLKSITDGEDNTTVLDIDVSGRTETITSADGRLTTVWTSDDEGNTVQLDETFDGQTRTTTFTYDDFGRRTSRTDPLNRTWAAEYDDVGNLVELVEPTTATTRFTYNDFGQPTSITGPLENVTTYEYDASGNLLREVDPTNVEVTYTYENGLRTSRTDAAGTTTWEYDDAGLVERVVDAEGHPTTFTHNAAGQVETITDARNGTTTFGYDPRGLLERVVGPEGGETVWTYDDLRRMTTQTDPTGNTTTFTHDGAGRLVSIARPLNRTTTFDYDAVGNVSAVTDPTDATTTYGYDGARRLTSVTDPTGRTTEYVVDAAGRVERVEDPAGRVTTLVRDDADRVISTESPSGVTSSLTYDLAGRVTSVADDLDNTTTFTYDDAGRLHTETDPRLNTTTYAYGPTGRLASVTDALDGTVAFDYDGVGRLVTVTDPLGRDRSLVHDEVGNLVEATDPATGTTAWTWDLAGRPTGRSDDRGVTVGYAYDHAGRLTDVTTPDGPITHGYDAAGRRTSLVDPTGTTTFTYDDADRLTGTDGPNGAVGHAYDDAGRRTSLTYPDASTVTYGYDPGGDLASVSDPDAGTVDIDWDGDGRLASVARPNGVTTNYQYDAASRLAEVAHEGATGDVARYAYTFDAAGNRVGMDGPDGAVAYELDELNRLVSATGAGPDRSYTYDAAGNRTSETVDGTTVAYAYDTGTGRLASVDGTAYEHDAAGNVTAAGSDEFTWDWAGRLVSARVDGTTTTATFDGDGVRTAVDGQAHAYDRTSSLPTLLASGSDRILHAAGPLAEVTAGETRWLHADALGSVGAITDAAGATVGTAAYAPFGAVSTSGTSSQFGFTGQQQDPTGLVHLRARSLDPGTGRMLSADTVQPNAPGTQGWHQYGYVANNPTTWTDPSGHVAAVEYSLGTSVRGGAAGAAFGAAFGVVDCGGLSGSMDLACVLRYAGSGALGGFVGSVPGLQGLGAFGVAGLSGVAESAAHQWLTGGIDWTQVGIDGALSAVTGGLIDGWLSRNLDTLGARTHLGEASPSRLPSAGASTGSALKPGSAGGPTAGNRFPGSVRGDAIAENVDEFGDIACVYCRMGTDTPHVDHVVPRVRGGNATLDNAQVTCPHCNLSKGPRDFPVNPPSGYRGPWPPSWWGIE